MNPRWSTIRSHYLFRVSLGYLALVWLLALVIVAVFPIFEISRGSMTLAIVLLILGFPLVLVLAWAFGTANRTRSPRNENAGTTGVRRVLSIERSIIAVLALALASIAVNQYVYDEPTAEAAVQPSQEPGLDLAAAQLLPNAGGVIRIGIISPLDGSRSLKSGVAHQSSIKLAITDLGPIRVRNATYEIETVSFNDRSLPEVSAEMALRLANEEDVAAIIGPVNSSATKAVLEALRREGIDIPVISALSTATDLIVSGRRDPNFFRLIFDDARRMTSLAAYIKNERGGKEDQNFLLIYEDDEYGRGLKENLKNSLYTTNVESVSWCEIVEAMCGDKDAALADGSVSRGVGFDAEIFERLVGQEFDNVVMLGTVPGSIAIAQGIRAFADRIQFWFVGSNTELFNGAPIGSITSGNPVLDPDWGPKPDSETVRRWNELFVRFNESYDLSTEDFVISAYEAAMVVHAALRSVLDRAGELPPLDRLRLDLRNEIEMGRFDSIEPYRVISFDYGQLSEPYIAPIYRIDRAASRLDEREVRRWIEVDLPRQFSFLEGPVRVGFRSDTISAARVNIFRIDEGRDDLVDTREIEFSAGRASADFHVFLPGRFRVEVENERYTPSLATTEIVVKGTYFISVVTALFGALIVAVREGGGFRKGLLRVGLGVFAGFALTFSALYGTDVAGWMPFPKFGEEAYVNAIVTGLIGGLLGPYVLAEVFLSWALTLSVGKGSGRRPPDMPEGL